MKLSLCIATFNEEKFIHYPLDSAYDFVDEVIIVDGGSDDKTVEIAKLYGPKVQVFVVDNPPMFHINKQRAIEKAKGEWILQLDADEALSPELKKEISDIVGAGYSRPGGELTLTTGGNTPPLQNSDAKYLAYWVPRKNFFLNRFLEKGGQYPDYTIRLYRNGAVRFPCKTVHENVEIISLSSRAQRSEVEGSSTTDSNKKQRLESVDQSAAVSDSFPIAIGTRNDSLRVGYLKSPLLHYADPEFSRYLKRWDRYTNLDAELILQRKESVSFFNYFFVQPFITFFMMYFRHKGFMDGFPGFVFALFSSIRFWVIYIKVWQKMVKPVEPVIR